MLIMTRKAQESVVVGGAGGFESHVKVTVLKIQGSRVRLGFEVDSWVSIRRSEAWKQLRTAEPAGSPPEKLDDVTVL